VRSRSPPWGDGDGEAVLAVDLNATFSDTEVPELPLPWNQVHRGVGVAAAVIVLLRLIVPSDECAGGFCVDLDRKFGIFVALIAAIVVAAGGFQKGNEPEATPSAGGDTGSAPF